MPNQPLCKVCFEPKSDCLCPECPQCGDIGMARCYKEHVLKLNQLQLILRTEKRIERMQEEVDLEKHYVLYLREKEETYCEDWSEF